MYRTIFNSPLSWLTAMTVAFQACTAPTEFTINGHIDGMPDSIRVTLIDIEDPNGDVTEIAETYTSGGDFTLTGSVKSPTMCNMSFSRYQPRRNGYGRVFSARYMAENGRQTVSSTISFDSLANVRDVNRYMKIDGSKANRELTDYIDFVNDAEIKAREIGYLGASKYFESNGNRDTVARYDAMEKAAQKELLDLQQKFIADHPAYNISAYVTQKEFEKLFVYTADEIEAMYDRITACPDTARIATVERRKAHALRYALKRQCPDFKATDPDGNIIDFTSLLTPGRPAFIDFWASWCGPCRAAIPHVRELQEKYGDRMDIFSVSVDESADDWREAMKEEQMTWPQYHLEGEDQLTQGAQAFFITSIPRLILLNDKGEVICSTNLPAEINAALDNINM